MAYLSESEDSLLGADHTSLDHNEVILNLSVVRESTHWCDRLIGDIVLSRGVVLYNLSILSVDTCSKYRLCIILHLHSHSIKKTI